MNFLIELLFPRRCPVCDRPVDKMGRYVCKKCRAELKYVEDSYCMKCGKSLKATDDEFCGDCKDASHIFDRGRALYEYETVKEAVYRFKYQGRREYAQFWGMELARVLGEEILSWRADAIIPVPLHKTREKQRGYNQAALIARELGKRLNIPVEEEFVGRIRQTLPQKNLKGKERQNNLKNAFKIRQNDVKLNTVIVVDDIYTTGTTMDEIAGCLKRAGIREIYCISLAVGRGI